MKFISYIHVLSMDVGKIISKDQAEESFSSKKLMVKKSFAEVNCLMCLMENQTMEYIDFIYDVKIYHKNVFNHIHLKFMNEHLCIKHFSFHPLMINKTITKEENVEPILNKYLFNIYHDHHFDHDFLHQFHDISKFLVCSIHAINVYFKEGFL